MIETAAAQQLQELNCALELNIPGALNSAHYMPATAVAEEPADVVNEDAAADETEQNKAGATVGSMHGQRQGREEDV